MDGAEQLNAIAVDLGQQAARVGAVAAAVVRKATLDIQATAQAFAPVDTGALRSSISSEFTGDGRSAAVEGVTGPTVDYGVHVEYGTARQAPQAFMGPAFDRHAGTFVDALAQLSGEAL